MPTILLPVEQPGHLPGVVLTCLSLLITLHLFISTFRERKTIKWQWYHPLVGFAFLVMPLTFWHMATSLSVQRDKLGALKPTIERTYGGVMVAEVEGTPQGYLPSTWAFQRPGKPLEHGCFLSDQGDATVKGQPVVMICSGHLPQDQSHQ